jgi:4'-phosphopantetheinyl transferase
MKYSACRRWPSGNISRHRSSRMTTEPILHDGVVVQFELTCSPEEIGGLVAVLSSDERERAFRFATKELQNRFIVGRARLRQILGCAVGKRAEEIHFCYNDFGKPFLDHENQSLLAFNLSHSASNALVAIQQDSAVGIDLEFDDHRIDPKSLAPQVFSPHELDRWKNVLDDDSRRVLLSAWVFKESVLKAEGIGFSGEAGMHSIQLPEEFFFKSPPLSFSALLSKESLKNSSTIAAKSRSEKNERELIRVRRLEILPQFHSALCSLRDPMSFACMCWEEFQTRF